MKTPLSTYHPTFKNLLFDAWRLRIIMLLFFINCTFLASAQTKVWEKTFGGLKDDYYKTTIATPDGGYLFGGTSNSGIGKDKTQESRGKHGCWVVKTDASGNKKWDKRFGGNSYDGLCSSDQYTGWRLFTRR